jgi:hypothetical protein
MIGAASPTAFGDGDGPRRRNTASTTDTNAVTSSALPNHTLRPVEPAGVRAGAAAPWLGIPGRSTTPTFIVGEMEGLRTAAPVAERPPRRAEIRSDSLAVDVFATATGTDGERRIGVAFDPRTSGRAAAAAGRRSTTRGGNVRIRTVDTRRGSAPATAETCPRPRTPATVTPEIGATAAV